MYNTLLYTNVLKTHQIFAIRISIFMHTVQFYFIFMQYVFYANICTMHKVGCLSQKNNQGEISIIFGFLQ